MPSPFPSLGHSRNQDDSVAQEKSSSKRREMARWKDKFVDANHLSEHIETQLRSSSPVFISGATALHRAAQQGLGAEVARLLAACPFLIDVPEQSDGQLSQGWTAFHHAAYAGHTAVMMQLLAVNPSFRTEDGWTALHFAVLHGRAAGVAEVLAANPTLIDARTNDGDTPLHVAVLTDDGAIVAQLLAANPALIDAKANNGRTALHEAAAHGKAAMVAQLLAMKPTLIDADYQDIVARLLDSNPMSSRITVAAQLIAAKPSLIEAIINDDDSWTALLKVMKLDHEEAATQLLAMHPELIHDNTSRDGGWTAFHKAAYFGSNKIMSRLLSQPDFEQLLLRRSTSGQICIEAGSTALHAAASQGNSNIVAQLLVACPSLVDVVDDEGRTCLHYAVSEPDPPHAQTVEVLLAFKPALVHAVDAYGNTILHAMCRAEHKTGLIEKVWKMNPDALHAECWRGCTPFHCAVTRSNDSVVDLLQWSVTVDEIADGHFARKSYVERFKPLLALQCEELAMKLLPDLVAIVFEYTGFGMKPVEEEAVPFRIWWRERQEEEAKKKKDAFLSWLVSFFSSLPKQSPTNSEN